MKSVTNNNYLKIWTIFLKGPGARVRVFFWLKQPGSRSGGGCLSVRDKSQRSCLPLSLFHLSVPSMLMFKSLPSYPVQTIPVLVSQYRTALQATRPKFYFLTLISA